MSLIDDVSEWVMKISFQIYYDWRKTAWLKHQLLKAYLKLF